MKCQRDLGEVRAEDHLLVSGHRHRGAGVSALVPAIRQRRKVFVTGRFGADFSWVNFSFERRF
jgi:hypothetical protein